MSRFNSLALEAELLSLDFRNMLVAQGKANPERSGMHASAVLVSENEWCVREQVLHHLFPNEALQGEGWKSWDWKKKAIFENGWDLHRRWQRLFLQQGNVVWTPVSSLPSQDIPESHLKMIDGEWYAAELDLTHFDEERQLYFSPDAIIQFGGVSYVIEIKGIKQESYIELTDDIEQAAKACETVKKAREQANLYCHLLNLKKAVLLIENKNTCDFRLYVIEYERERAQLYIDRIYAVKRDTALARRHGVNASFPTRKCESSSETRAQKCPMRRVCFEQKESEDW